jgi:hypothetical protein
LQEIGAKKSVKNSNAEVKRTQKAIFMVRNIKKNVTFLNRNYLVWVCTRKDEKCFN